MTLDNIAEYIDPKYRQIGEFIQKNPYSRLMRLDKPIGIYLTLLPALWAIAFAADTFLHVLWLFIIFTVGAIIIRGAGCVLNDIADKELDKKVARTKSRPLASGELTVSDAYKFLFILLGIGFLILLTLPTPVVLIGIFAIIPIAAYPYFKRFTYFPQIFLGFVFNLGVFMGWFAANPRASIVPFMLYFASLLWTVGYDTIYGLQDKRDDSKAGIKSMSLLFGDNTPKMVWKFYLAAMTLITLTGLNSHMNYFFYLFVLIGGYHLYWQAETLKINSSADCLKKFKSNAQFGLIILIGILIGRI